MAYANQHEWQAERNAPVLAERIMSPLRLHIRKGNHSLPQALHLVDMASIQGIMTCSHDERKQHLQLFADRLEIIKRLKI